MARLAGILVVEDDKTYSDFLEKILSFNGYTIQLARTGQDALALMAGDMADLVLLDVGLPDIDGFGILERIEADSPDTPVILMTGDASIESATKALKSGAYDYLAKPLEPSKLFKTIQNALDHKSTEEQRRKAVKKLG